MKQFLKKWKAEYRNKMNEIENRIAKTEHDKEIDRKFCELMHCMTYDRRKGDRNKHEQALKRAGNAGLEFGFTALFYTVLLYAALGGFNGLF